MTNHLFNGTAYCEHHLPTEALGGTTRTNVPCAKCGSEKYAHGGIVRARQVFSEERRKPYVDADGRKTVAIRYSLDQPHFHMLMSDGSWRLILVETFDPHSLDLTAGETNWYGDIVYFFDGNRHIEQVVIRTLQ